VKPGPFTKNCLCCGSTELAREWAATSSFFAWRALLRGPEVVPLLLCKVCKTRYFDVAVEDAELARLYADYRGAEYFRLRHQFEPWYTRAVNDDLGGETAMRQRRTALAQALQQSGVTTDFATVLDHGGDRGQMLLELNAPFKAVYEISGTTPEAGVVSVDAVAMKNTRWDLILSCHVLEHLTDPPAYVAKLVSLGHDKTVYFFEVPDEGFSSFAVNRSMLQNFWLKLIVKSPGFFKAFDFLSTGFRVRFRVILPLLFLPLREHLTFYSVDGAVQMLESAGLQVVSGNILKTGHIGLVALKRRNA
jgi:hypothetical protein